MVIPLEAYFPAAGFFHQRRSVFSRGRLDRCCSGLVNCVVPTTMTGTCMRETIVIPLKTTQVVLFISTTPVRIVQSAPCVVPVQGRPYLASRHFGLSSRSKPSFDLVGERANVPLVELGLEGLELLSWRKTVSMQTVHPHCKAVL